MDAEPHVDMKPSIQDQIWFPVAQGTCPTLRAREAAGTGMLMSLHLLVDTLDICLHLSVELREGTNTSCTVCKGEMSSHVTFQPKHCLGAAEKLLTSLQLRNPSFHFAR